MTLTLVGINWMAIDNGSDSKVTAMLGMSASDLRGLSLKVAVLEQTRQADAARALMVGCVALEWRSRSGRWSI
jgi:hypothetical protein